jgi:putative sugar O-methyltransferase
MSLDDEPSEFWKRLAAEHSDALSEFGLDHFKRHQALRYFNWQWTWRRLRGSEQFRFLLANTPPAAWVRSAAGRVKLRDPAWQHTGWSVADRWLYCFAVRLLWSYAEAHDPAGVTSLPEPSLGGPFPVQRAGRLVSQDLANTALEVAALQEALAGRKPARFLEVGAGYGRMAHALLSVYPDATYTIIDIEPAILICRWYLSQLFAPERLRFLSPGEAELLAPGSTDVALSVSSLQEMTPAQVAAYLRLFDNVAAGGTVFLKQWDVWTNPVDEVTMAFDDYPIPGRWKSLLRSRAPVQTRFVQAAWDVPAGVSPAPSA